MAKSLGDIYTQGSFTGKSSGTTSVDYLDEVYQDASGTSGWDVSTNASMSFTEQLRAEAVDYTGRATSNPNYAEYFADDSDFFIRDESGDWAYTPDSRSNLFWEYDLTKEKNIEKMFDKKMDTLSGTIDTMFRTSKENIDKTSIEIGRANLMSSRHLDEIKDISQDAKVKLTKAKADINIDSIKTDMKVQKIRKQYEGDMLSAKDELSHDSTNAAIGMGDLIKSGDVGKYSLKKGSVGDEITINGQTYRWQNYDTVWKAKAITWSNPSGRVRRYGWVREGTSDSDWDTF